MEAVISPDRQYPVADAGKADERIVAALLEKGRLKEADLARARRLQEETGGSLLSLLARLGLVSERDHAETCAEVLDLPLVGLKQVPELPPEASPEAVALSPRFLRQFQTVFVAEFAVQDQNLLAQVVLMIFKSGARRVSHDRGGTRHFVAITLQ